MCAEAKVAAATSAGFGYFVTSLLYLWADLDVVVTATTDIELGCSVLYFLAAVIDAWLWVESASPHWWHALSPLKLGMWSAVFNVVPAALYLVAGVLGVALQYISDLPVDRSGRR